jgi:hypothetical protein
MPRCWTCQSFRSEYRNDVQLVRNQCHAARNRKLENWNGLTFSRPLSRICWVNEACREANGLLAVESDLLGSRQQRGTGTDADDGLQQVADNLLRDGTCPCGIGHSRRGTGSTFKDQRRDPVVAAIELFGDLGQIATFGFQVNDRGTEQIIKRAAVRRFGLLLAASALALMWDFC